MGTPDHMDYPVDLAKVSVQVMPLIRSLRAILLESRPLTPGDITLPNEASKKDIPPPELPAKRLQDLIAGLKKVVSDAALPGGILDYLNTLPQLGTATEPELAAMAQRFDITLASFAALLLDLGRYGIAQTGIGSFYDQRREWFVSVKTRAQEFIDRWQKNSNDYDVLAAGPTPTVETLQNLERLIATALTPADAPITLAIVQTKKSAFDAEFSKLKTAVATNHASLIGLIKAVQAINTAPFDILSLDLGVEMRQIPLFSTICGPCHSPLNDLLNKRIPE